jgi:hypothetical protein
LIALGFLVDGSVGRRRYEKNLSRIKTDLLSLSRLVHFSQACPVSRINRVEPVALLFFAMKLV